MPAARSETDVQCKRCGSSMAYEPCEHCVDGYNGHECDEDVCACPDPEENVECDVCEADGGRYICLSSTEWCEANPLPGRSNVERHTPEWF